MTSATASSDPAPSPTVWDPDRLARAGLTAACPPASPKLLGVIAAEGAAAVWEALRRTDTASGWSARARTIEVASLVERSAAMGLRFLVPGDDEWPDLSVLDAVELGTEGGGPIGLWVRGEGHLGRLCRRAVAVVGARASTPYGEHVAADLAHDLARAGWAIVSGGAYGIDAAAHRGALAATGATVAWLAGGLDRLYPAGNQEMFESILETGVVAGEHPIGAHPSRHGFLTRNRLIAASAAGTILVEGAARSGARNTVSWAGACGRSVMAVPGPVTSTMSVTPHRLIRDSLAVLVSDAEDVRAVLAPLGEGPQPAVGGGPRRLDELPEILLRVREALPGRGGAAVGDIAVVSGTSVRECLAALAELEERGLVSADSNGRWRACRPT